MADIFRPTLSCHGDTILAILLSILLAVTVVSAADRRYSASEDSRDVVGGDDDDGCGKTQFTSNAGEIKSPNFPRIYPNDVMCEYVITVDAGFSIWLRFIEISMETSIGCESDSIMVYEGNRSDNVLIAKMCDFQPSRSALLINDSLVTIVFQSNNIGTSTGFRALYYTFQPFLAAQMERQTYHICQDNVGMALSGAILSHTNYPGNDYPADVTCDLAIDPGGRFVGVYITFFDVSLKVFQVDTLQRKCSPPSESVVVSSLYPDVPTNLTVCQNDGNRSSTAIGSTVLVSLNTASHNGIHYRGFKAVFTQYYPPNVSYEATSPCHKDDFYCVGVFRCIPGFLRCDGVNHCGNYVDETNCPDEFKVPSKNDICNPDEFYCGSYAGPGRTCISKQFVCDGKKLCSNGADEKSCKIAVESGLSAKAMVGVVLGLLQVVVLAAFITRYMHGRRRKKKRNRVLTNTGYDAIALEPR